MLNEFSRSYGKTKVLTIEALKEGFAKSQFSYVQIALLFGSRACGTQNDRSDYDFALLMCDEQTAWGMQSKAWHDIGIAFNLSDQDIDVIDLAVADKVIIESIKKGYWLLKGSEDDVERLFAKN
jgi:hypothetical protein